jgi:RNA polymerase sigma-70 factor (ECF subfamily)
VPFDEIAQIVEYLDRGTAARQPGHAAGAGGPRPDPDLARRREVVDAFLAAARGGEFDALVALLDPDVVLRPTSARCLAAHRGRSGGARAVPSRRSRSRGGPGSRKRR